MLCGLDKGWMVIVKVASFEFFCFAVVYFVRGNKETLDF